MSFSLLSRSCIVLSLAALLAACSSTKPAPSSVAVSADPECRSNRKSCLYEGSYEPGERRYAEEAARRLNEAQIARLRGIGR
jgi:hypothetical protein